MPCPVNIEETQRDETDVAVAEGEEEEDIKTTLGKVIDVKVDDAGVPTRRCDVDRFSTAPRIDVANRGISSRYGIRSDAALLIRH